MTRAAFFDLDKTLVRVNTGRLYAQWKFKRGESSLREALRVAKWMTQYTFGKIDAKAVTERALASLVGVAEEDFLAEMQEWFDDCVIQEVSAKARAAVQTAQVAGHPTVLLSASSNYAADLVASEMNIPHVISTRLELNAQGQFTGKTRQLCYGENKVPMAQTWADAHDVLLSDSVFYTDSISDLPMLLAVGEPRVINPDPRLRRLAKRRGWRVERWR